MTKFTIEDLRDIAYCGSYDDLERELALQLLASMEQEPVAYMHHSGQVVMREECCDDEIFAICCKVETPLYAAPQLPQPAVPDMAAVGEMPFLGTQEKAFVSGWNACRAAMLQGAEPASNCDELPLDYLQGHKDGLEWAAQLAKPIIRKQVTGCTTTQSSLPERFEKVLIYLNLSQYLLMRMITSTRGLAGSGMKIIRKIITQHLQNRCLVRWLNLPIGQVESRQRWLPTLHNSDGWQLVPKEPTEAMNKAGWAAINEHDAINPTYRAMLAAAPQQEVKLALEHGMQRYAGAMQKLVDSGD